MSKSNWFVGETIDKFMEKKTPFKLSEIRKENGGVTWIYLDIYDKDYLNQLIEQKKLKLGSRVPGEEPEYIPL